MRTKEIRIDEIAATAGVSKSTVSRVLAGAANVREETRAAVLKTIQELNYVSPALVKGGGTAYLQRRNIVVIIPDIINPLWAIFVRHIQRALFEHGYMMTLYEARFQQELEKRYLDQIQENGASAIITVSSLPNDAACKRYADMNCPVIFLDRSLEGNHLNSVIQDNFQAGYIATKHLVEQGYQEIAFVGGPSESISSMNRLSGYRSALKHSFINVNDALIETGEMSIRRGVSLGDKFLRNPLFHPQAIVIGNEEIAIGFIDHCKFHGVSIPEDVAIVTFDDTPYSKLHHFDITSIRQPIDDMAYAAVEIAVKGESSNFKPVEGEKRILLQPELVIRSSSVVSAYPDLQQPAERSFYPPF